MILKVYVTPSASSDSIEKIDETTYRIRVKQPADKNRANKRVINILAKELSVSVLSIKIKNPLSRKKIIEINI